MISKHLSYHHNFDEIMKNDPVKQIGPEYWNLRAYPNATWCKSENNFNHDEIRRIIVIGKRLIPKRAQTAGNGEDCLDSRRSFVSWISANSETEWIFRRLVDCVTESNKKFWNFDLEKIEKLQFTHYLSQENGAYVPHVDPLIWDNSHNRKLSFVLQLSDPSEYEGGELKLHVGNSPIVVEKRRGLSVFFPSYVLHEVTPVTKGERYSLVAWIHGPNLR